MICVAGAALSLSASGVRAEDVSADEILRALIPPETVTRSLSGSRRDSAPAPAPEDTSFLDSLRGRAANSLTSNERAKLASFTSGKPSIDVRINFDFNSDKVGPGAASAVKEVGKALTSSQLTGKTFVIAGHTDGKGSDPYNQSLSERRADEVKRYLIENFNIPAANLLAAGFGKSALKNPQNPMSAENRRVQIVNVSGRNVADKN